ncbi:MAG: hypothetical protein LIO67_01930 [Lachnospiraceae bacterium]|nr:hypothetical protein [Lachnospiraceae bacterium]
MKEIMTVTKELEQRARKIADFRSDVKAYLLRHDACLDKFTVTGNDSFLGYVSEAEIAQKPVLKAGTRTRFGTLNQIDNYETRLTDYHPIAGLIDYLTKGRDLF